MYFTTKLFLSLVYLTSSTYSDLINNVVHCFPRQLEQLETKVSRDISTILSILQSSSSQSHHSAAPELMSSDSHPKRVLPLQQQPPHRSTSQPSDMAQVCKSCQFRSFQYSMLYLWEYLKLLMSVEA